MADADPLDQVPAPLAAQTLFAPVGKESDGRSKGPDSDKTTELCAE